MPILMKISRMVAMKKLSIVPTNPTRAKTPHLLKVTSSKKVTNPVNREVTTVRAVTSPVNRAVTSPVNREVTSHDREDTSPVKAIIIVKAVTSSDRVISSVINIPKAHLITKPMAKAKT